MKTGIKISSPSTFCIGKANKGIVYFALSNPLVSVTFKPGELSQDEIKITGLKSYSDNYIKNSLAFIRSLDLFSSTKSLRLEINNHIPFGFGFGSHVSCFATLLKGLCVINKVSLTNRELYNIIVQAQGSPLRTQELGRLLTCLEGGSMFTDFLNSEINQRIFLPTGLSIIIFNPDCCAANVVKEEPINQRDFINGLELLLGLSSSNWKLIETGLGNKQLAIKNLDLMEADFAAITTNCVGIDFNGSKNSYAILCQNTLQSDLCFKILNQLIEIRNLKSSFLYSGPFDYNGTKQL